MYFVPHRDSVTILGMYWVFKLLSNILVHTSTPSNTKTSQPTSLLPNGARFTSPTLHFTRNRSFPTCSATTSIRSRMTTVLVQNPLNQILHSRYQLPVSAPGPNPETLLRPFLLHAQKILLHIIRLARIRLPPRHKPISRLIRPNLDFGLLGRAADLPVCFAVHVA